MEACKHVKSVYFLLVGVVLEKLGVTKADLDETWGKLCLQASRSSYTAHGLQKQPEILNNLFVVFDKNWETHAFLLFSVLYPRILQGLYSPCKGH